MKALLCKSFGPPESLVLEDVPSPEAGPGKVVVSVRGCSLNFPDLLVIQDKYQYKPPLPFSPGAEISGVVKSVGPGVTGCKPGDRVMAYIMHGGFAEEVAVDADILVPIPPALDFVRAAAFLMTYGTALYALRNRARIAAGESLLVLGAAGGTGIAAIEVGKTLGARVIAAASSAEKLALCRKHGADETIDYASEDLKQRIRDLTGGKGADVVFDPVGGRYSEAALRSTAWEGRFLVIGFAAGEIARVPLNLPLLRNCSVMGSPWGAFLRRSAADRAAHQRELVALIEGGRIDPPVSATYPLDRAHEALRAMMDRRVLGKVVVVPA
jgi:NADPH2:quinone reductase